MDFSGSIYSTVWAAREESKIATFSLLSAAVQLCALSGNSKNFLLFHSPFFHFNIRSRFFHSFCHFNFDVDFFFSFQFHSIQRIFFFFSLLLNSDILMIINLNV